MTKYSATYETLSSKPASELRAIFQKSMLAVNNKNLPREERDAADRTIQATIRCLSMTRKPF